MAFLGSTLESTARIVKRRLAGRRTHPSWSLPYEVGVQLCGASLYHDGPASPRSGGRRRTTAVPVPPMIRARLDFQRDTLAGLPTEVHTPRGGRHGGRTLLYLHGGGYVACSPATHRGLAARLALASVARTFVPDYRKAPEHPFPAAIDDCLAAYQGLLAEGVDPSELVIGGDSAGGGLTLAVLQRLRELGAPMPTACLLLSPWVDLTERGGSVQSAAPYDYLRPDGLDKAVRDYAAKADPRAPLLSALHADLNGLPPMLVLTGELELFRDQNVDFVSRARAQGVDVVHEIAANMVHVYPLLADVSRTARAGIDRAGKFARAHARSR